MHFKFDYHNKFSRKQFDLNPEAKECNKICKYREEAKV